jgi:Cu/Ag efflux protein CusF
MRSLLLLALACSLAAQGAAAAEDAKAAKQEATYRQVTGEVVSMTADKIAIKSRSKGTMTLTITKTTDMIGQPVKEGDKATVHYRSDGNGNTATRISAKNAKAAAKRTPAASAAR